MTLPEKTEPTVGCPFDPRVYTLLIKETLGRQELIHDIQRVRNCQIPEGSFSEEVELIFISIEEYTADIKELTDLLKQG